MPGSAIEVRTYEGDAAGASRFVQAAWRAAYGARSIVPLWDERYFEWQVFARRPPEDREWLVAAYEGARLVGLSLAEPFAFALRGEPLVATQASWFSVDPGTLRRGVARALVEEQRRRHRARGAAFMGGFGVRGSLGPRFWQTFPDTVQLGGAGFWYRVLDGRRLAKVAPAPGERILTRLVAAVSERSLAGDDPPGVRSYVAADLDRCEELAAGAAEGCDLAFRWSRERLAIQLEHEGLPRTLVLEARGRVEGLVNWYPLETEGRTRTRISVVDLLAFGEAEPRDRRGLVAAALRRMAAEDGSTLAMVLRRPGRDPSRALLATGFVPMPAEFDGLATIADPAVRLEGLRRVHFHWR